MGVQAGGQHHEQKPPAEELFSLAFSLPPRISVRMVLGLIYSHLFLALGIVAFAYLLKGRG